MMNALPPRRAFAVSATCAHLGPRIARGPRATTGVIPGAGEGSTGAEHAAGNLERPPEPSARGRRDLARPPEASKEGSGYLARPRNRPILTRGILRDPEIDQILTR